VSARILFIFIYFATTCVFATTVKDLAKDAEASRSSGDFFKAYRSFLVLESQKPKHFGHLGAEGYLNSLFVVGGEEAIRDECDRFLRSGDSLLSAKATYLCGLHFLEKKDTTKSETYLQKVSAKSGFHWPAQILMCSVDLLKNEPDKAIKILSVQDIKQYTKYELEDRFYLCRARAFTMQNKFEEAIKEFQAISSGSPFYADALNETAWVFFKMRRFESAHVLLDVLVGNYETKKRAMFDLKITPTVYYRARYLRAYLALVEQRPEGAVNEFLDLKNDYDKFLSKNKPGMDIVSTLQLIRDGNQDWTDIRYIPPVIIKQLDLIGEWMGPEVRETFKRDILLQMGLTREVQRMARAKDEVTEDAYVDDLEQLQDTSWRLFVNRYTRVLKKTEQNMSTLSLKAEVGRLEVIWLGRAQGARNLDEVIDNYGQSVRAIDDFIEPGLN
jgi:tetratricopeptide (TPR) repeat protein